MRRRGAWLVAAAVAVASAALPASATASNWTIGASAVAGQGRARPIPGAPTGVTTACGGGGAGSFTVSWNTSSTVTSYLVQYSTTGSGSGFDAGTSVAPTAGTTSYVYNTVSVLTTYWVRVWAYTGTWSSLTAGPGNSSRSILLGLICT
ncbi:fibronectin type III domain-containing protein [Jatrophihabitans sp.]|uniref:fibronectin type III domain-containing protein n=1 Tax=Jatrophihabitans sp. TaxID=1932789 RepID=UPI003F7F8F5E